MTEEPGASETRIKSYYTCFNERRFREAAALFTSDAVVLHVPFGQQERGARAYLRFTETWIRAFPDAVLIPRQIKSRGETLWDVDLRASGTHLGALELGLFGTFKPSGAETTLHMRELLDIRDGQIVYSSLSLDIQALIQQLTIVDDKILLTHLDRIGELRTELARVSGDPSRRREVIQRLGRELDATRHVVRPHFKE
jgi:SnoaL-like protein